VNTIATRIVVSHYGNRTICWDAATLETLLTKLRDEQKAHEVRVATESSEAEHNALMVSAEQIKQQASNAIAQAEPEHEGLLS